MDYLLKINSTQNPMRLPLNELNLEFKNFRKSRKTNKNEVLDGEVRNDLKRNYDVRLEKLPALDKQWLQVNHPFYLYQPYFPEVSEDENESFFSKNVYFLESIEFLLKCSYQQFWCYITSDPNVQKVIKSFIYNASPWYEVKHFGGRALEFYSRIHERMSQLFCRLLTYRQSETEYMYEVTIIKYLEEANLLTFTIVARLCLLYKNSNQNFVIELVNVYSLKYESAFMKNSGKMIEQAMMVFEMIGGHICGFDQTAVILPLGIGPKPKQFDPYWYADAMLLLVDTISNLNAFLTVSTDVVKTAIELDVTNSLIFFYNKVFTRLYKILNSQRGVAFDWSNLKDRILDQMAVARSEFISTFHIFVSRCVDDILQAQGDHGKQDECLENYINLISTAMDADYFIADYHNTNEIDLQLQLIADFYPEHDKMRTNYIIQCLTTLPKLKPLQTMQELPQQTPTASTSFNSEQVNNIKPNAARKPPEDEIELKIKFISDTLPHLGDGFIFKCLEAYNYETEEVISAILDNNLPPHIQNEPLELIRIPPEPEPKQPILAYRGKKPRVKDTTDMLNDKSEMKDMKEFILKTSNAYDMYDDDYDDRYDYEAPVRPDQDKDDPYKYMENRFEGYDLVSDPSESSSDEEVIVKEKPKVKSKNFCEDPAALREQRESQRKNPSKDLVGKPKGQGQDKKVVQNRNKKEVNKSTKGNHNRKGASQWKRNKGMIPS